MFECEALSVERQRHSSPYERMTSESKRDRDISIARDTGNDSESLPPQNVGHILRSLFHLTNSVKDF